MFRYVSSERHFFPNRFRKKKDIVRLVKKKKNHFNLSHHDERTSRTFPINSNTIKFAILPPPPPSSPSSSSIFSAKQHLTNITYKRNEALIYLILENQIYCFNSNVYKEEFNIATFLQMISITKRTNGNCPLTFVLNIGYSLLQFDKIPIFKELERFFAFALHILHMNESLVWKNKSNYILA
ncbi:hypothetical protein BLOT_000038 [Blomia tropicalis]|nr:hypothetical protein BLOT_000038 [Blomia tropicalis]